MPKFQGVLTAVILLLLPGCPGDEPADDDDITADDDDDATADDDDTSGEPRVRLMLHGGGAEEDDIYGLFVEAAGAGHLVTLGAVEEPESYPDLLFWDGYFVGLGAASAQTLNTGSAADAGTQEVVDALAAADGIYIRGGDQSRYLEHWTGTALHDGLREAWERGAVVGGSSAGCALLGERVYDASVGSVAAWEALLDPQDPYITFTDGFLDALPGVITDTHFTERGRVGRLAVFVERWRADGEAGPLGVGVDPMTALFVWSDGTAEVVGNGSVTLLEPATEAATLTAGRPPDIRGQRLWQLPAGYRVDLGALPGGDPVLERPAYAVPWTGWEPLPGDFGALSLSGSVHNHRYYGEWTIDGLEAHADAWRDGDLFLAGGSGDLPGVLLVTALYEDSDYYENHLGGMAWALAQHPETVVVGLDVYLSAAAEPPATLTTASDGYLLVLDGRSMTHAGVPGDGGWLTAALEGALLSVVGPDSSWSGLDAP
jgi:cyanophycinase